MNLNQTSSGNLILGRKILPVEMYLDVHFPFVYDNIVEHTTNIHHVFSLMYHHVVRQWLVDNPRKHSFHWREKLDMVMPRTHNNFHAFARYCFGIPFQLALRNSSTYESNQRFHSDRNSSSLLRSTLGCSMICLNLFSFCMLIST